MCLYITEHPKQMTAKEDIKCYKVLEAYPTYDKGKIIEGETIYISPYQDMQYYLGGTIREESRVKREYEDEFGELPMISEGCLHTFTNLDQAIDFVKQRRYPLYPVHQEWVVVECIIPKGTKYYEGVTGVPNPRSSYASKVLYVTDNIAYKTY